MDEPAEALESVKMVEPTVVVGLDEASGLAELVKAVEPVTLDVANGMTELVNVTEVVETVEILA